MHIRQYVDLVGLNTDSFRRCVDNIHALNETLSRIIPGDILEPWRADGHGQGNSISASSRYFTRERDARGETAIPFSTTEDPQGTLESLGEDNYIHIEDNVVAYYKAISEGERKRCVVTN